MMGFEKRNTACESGAKNMGQLAGGALGRLKANGGDLKMLTSLGQRYPSSLY